MASPYKAIKKPEEFPSHLRYRILERLGLQEEPYAALFLKEVNDPIIDKQKLQPLLFVAGLLSKHAQLIFPISGSVSRFIDEVFDELFKGRRQMFKDFVVRSKGIIYAKDLTAGEKSQVLERAAFVITTDNRISKIALNNNLPYIYLSQCENNKPEIIVLNYERGWGRYFKHGLMAALEAQAFPTSAAD